MFGDVLSKPVTFWGDFGRVRLRKKLTQIFVSSVVEVGKLNGTQKKDPAEES